MSDYSEKLKDPRWQKKRLEILNRDKWTCQNCGDTESTLVVHHTIYSRDREPWDYSNGLKTLCEQCHEDEHKNGWFNNEFINPLLARHLTIDERYQLMERLGKCDKRFINKLKKLINGNV